jgi:hypothetical protein
MKKAVVALALLATASAVQARELCADRPGMGTPACTVDPGRVVVEVGLGDWTLDKTADSRTDTIVAGDGLVRVGIADHAEVQIGWTAYGHVRERDRASGAIDRSSGIGDVTLAVRRNLVSPDGSGFSIALMPYATLPAGGQAIGDGTWSAGLIVPVSFDLNDTLSLALTPEADAAADEDRHGRHLNIGSVAGLGVKLSKAVQATGEVSLFRDRDPEGHTTQALAGLSLAWQPGDDWQLDLGVNAGLNHVSPDADVYGGIVRRF